MMRIPADWYVPLVELLSKLYGEEVHYTPGLVNSGLFYNDHLDLYIRVTPGHRLTIARIDVGYHHMRKGIGSAILDWCLSYCRMNRIPEICMESVLTEECRSFCIKKGFTLRYPNDDLCFDWVLQV